jgi:hypothetical protein
VQARKLVKPLLLAAHHSGGGVDDFVRLIYDGQSASEQVRAALRAAGLADAEREYNSTWTIHPEGQGSVLFTAYGLVDAYSRPSVKAAAARGDFHPDMLFGERPGTLLIVAPESEVDRLGPLLTALIASVVHAAESRPSAVGGRLEPRLLLALDEGGNVFRFPRLPHLLTTARGNGVQLLLIYHDLAQLENSLGLSAARTVVSNAKLRMLLPGVADLDTLRYFSDMLGRATVRRVSTTTAAGGQRSQSVGDSAEELVRGGNAGCPRISRSTCQSAQVPVRFDSSRECKNCSLDAGAELRDSVLADNVCAVLRPTQDATNSRDEARHPRRSAFHVASFRLPSSRGGGRLPEGETNWTRGKGGEYDV